MAEPVDVDVRMRGFSRRIAVSEAQAWVDQQTSDVLAPETVELDALAGRVLHADVVSGVDVPGFDRAMMDGYALHAADTQGASSYNQLTCRLIGESLPGAPFEGRVEASQAVRIMTGAPMPAGADAVLPAELCEGDDERVTLMGEVPPGKHVGRRGEDVAAGDRPLQRGRRLRPQDVGLLSSIGAANAAVVRAVRVRIVITGDELLPPGTEPRGSRIADANGPMLAALVGRDGGKADRGEITPDDPERILDAMRCDADIVLVSGGSSVGQEDHAPVLLDRHGQLAVHGVAMRPSSPAGMGRLGQSLVFLLPGNPVSCLCAYDFFAGRAIRRLAGLGADWPYRRVTARLRRKLVSAVGRTDYARVRIQGDEVEPLAISGASVLSSTSRADGFVIVPSDSEGVAAGGQVTVYRYDG